MLEPYIEKSVLDFVKERQVHNAAAQQAEALNLHEKRQLLVAAITAFREYKAQLVYDKDVLTLIQEQGNIPFDVWMNAVLYGPDGYYTSGRCRINGGDFITVVDDPIHVAALYTAMQEHLATQEKGPDKKTTNILSVAPGAGDFERHFLALNTYLQQMAPELALPLDMRLYSLDISERSLIKMQTQTNERFSLENLSYPYFPKDDRIEFCKEYEDHDGPLFSVAIQVMKEVCSSYDCAGTILSDQEYADYYQLYILPYLKTRTDDMTYSYLCDHPEYIRRLAPYFERSVSIPIAGSGFELPFGNASLDIIFSNEFHSTHPSKVFVINPDSGDFEELCVTYNLELQQFSLETRPVDHLSKPLLALELAYIDAQDPATGAGSLPVMRTPQGVREYLVVNIPSVVYFIEAARALKKGGLLIEGDYARIGEHDGKVTHGLEEIRMPGGGGYFGSPGTIGEYTQPWRDVTTDNNPGFLSWLAPVLGLELVIAQTQNQFTFERMGKPARYFSGNFEVVAFVKK